ncbi:TniQ family protein [Curtobacterium sp. B8]|uniref:TniQ family protein n=1 Tax=Curtobacterium sp. B8 TaxID=95611 RepID=UPI0003B66DE3|nr:TniQ family protein [Curtobacterium sp. B8]
MTRAPKQPYRITVQDVRPLGATVTVFEHEWLPSLFRRVGYFHGQPAVVIAHWCGLYDLTGTFRNRLPNVLHPKATAGIAAGLSCDPTLLRTTVMSRLAPDLIALRPDGTVSQSMNWTRGAGTRYCPDCLAEQPGVFYTYWRTWWSFLCLKHHTPLRDSCPACNSPIVEANVMETETRNPNQCQAELDSGGICGHALTDGWPEAPVLESSPAYRAQVALSKAWVETKRPRRPVDTSTLRGIAIALLRTRDIDLVSSLSNIPGDALEGLIEDTERIGTTPPRDALAMSALIGAAHRLATDPEPEVSATIRRITFSRPVRTTQKLSGPGSASHLLEFWPGIGAPMRGRVLRALDGDLPDMQRLVHATAVSPGFAELIVALEEPDPRIERTGWSWNTLALATEQPLTDVLIPPLMWPTWANPLGVDPITDPSALQRGLADAFRVAGVGVEGGTERIAGIGRKLRPSMLGTSEQATAVLQQLGELAGWLRLNPSPINYVARRYLRWSGLLPEADWRLLSGSVGEHPGRGRRLLNAQRYAWLRLTAAGTRDLPQHLEFQLGSPDAANYTRFLTTMSAELQSAIDDYLAAWLPKHRMVGAFPGVGHVRAFEDEPVVWAPPRWRPSGSPLAPELDDIDLIELHDRVRAGEYALTHLAIDLRRSPRHVRWALAAHPVPSGQQQTRIDWGSRIDYPDSI